MRTAESLLSDPHTGCVQGCAASRAVLSQQPSGVGGEPTPTPPSRTPCRPHPPWGPAARGGGRRRLAVCGSVCHLHRSLLLEPKRKASQPKVHSPGPSPPPSCLAQPPYPQQRTAMQAPLLLGRETGTPVRGTYPPPPPPASPSSRKPASPLSLCPFWFSSWRILPLLSFLLDELLRIPQGPACKTPSVSGFP